MVLHIAVLDVGHGDCIVIYDDARSSSLVIDCGHGPTLLDFLERESVSHVDLALVTHNDADHISGMTTVLDNVQIGCLALHPTIRNLSGVPKRSLVGLYQAVERHQVLVADVSTTCSRLQGRLAGLPFHAELVYPNPNRSLRASTANTASGILRVEHEGTVALFGGDLDWAGWDDLFQDADSVAKIRAQVFKFPHHGGRLVPVDGDPRQSSERTMHLLQRISPELTIISTADRVGWNHPDPGVMEALRHYGATNTHRIACTEVTRLCDTGFAAQRGHVLEILPEEHCSYRLRDGEGCPCAGTIRVDLFPGGIFQARPLDEHSQIIDLYEHPQCRRRAERGVTEIFIPEAREESDAR